jgi:hypothetical protein
MKKKLEDLIRPLREDLIKPLKRKLEIKLIKRDMHWLWPRMTNLSEGRGVNYFVKYINNIPHLDPYTVVDINSPDGLYFLCKRTYKGLNKALQDGSYRSAYSRDTVTYLRRARVLKKAA